jgi:uncharacterized protein YozE (UPF0346 family)
MGHICELCDPAFQPHIYPKQRIQPYIVSKYVAAAAFLYSSVSVGDLPVKPFSRIK